MMDTQNIRIRLKAFDHRLLDQSTKEIVHTAKKNRGKCKRSDPSAYQNREVYGKQISAR